LLEQVAIARRNLLAVMEELKKTPPADSVQRSVIAMDAQIAQRIYESLNEKRQQSELLMSFETEKQGQMLEVVDPASLPHSAEWRRAVAPVAAVLMALCLLGGVISLLQSARQAKLARWIPGTLVADARRGPAVFEAVQEAAKQPRWMNTSRFYRALGRLIEKGVVERTASPVRRRLRLYRLTEAGREFVEEEYDGPELPTPVVPMPMGRAG
jgi:hypothetical protein